MPARTVGTTAGSMGSGHASLYQLGAIVKYRGLLVESGVLLRQDLQRHRLVMCACKFAYRCPGGGFGIFLLS